MKQIRILVADDDPLVVNALSSLLNHAEDMTVVATALDGQQALDRLDTVDVDLVLADIHMPKLDGVALLSEILAKDDPPVFISITALASEKSALKVIEMGGSGYILKSQPPEMIIASLREAMNGGVVVAPHAMNWIAQRLATSSSVNSSLKASVDEVAEQKHLSDSESEVLILLCRGLGNQEIADRLFYSESMIKKHVSHLMKSFGVHSRLELVVSVLNRQWK